MEAADRDEQDDAEDLGKLLSFPLPQSGQQRQRESDANFPGSELLIGASAREVLAKITPGDPLGIEGRSLKRLRERALLVSHPRLLPRTLARTAHAARGYRGEPPLAEWLTAQIDRAIDDLVLEDREDQAAGRATTEPWDPRYAFVSEAWGVPPELARAACIVFNDLPRVVRRAYYALAVEGKSINRFVAEGNGPPQVVEARVKRAFIAMSKLRDPGGEDRHGPEERTRHG